MTDASASAAVPTKSKLSIFKAAFRIKRKIKADYEKSPKELLKEGKIDVLISQINTFGAFTDEQMLKFRKEMLKNKKLHAVLAKNPDLAVQVIKNADPKQLSDDFFNHLGAAKDDIVANSLVAVMNPFNPDVYETLAKRVSKDMWNDKGLGMGQEKRGLGPNILAGLFEAKAFDQVCDLIDTGVKTHKAAQTKKSGGTAYSGFVMPLEHIVQKYLHDVAKLGTDAAKDWPQSRIDNAEGAKKILKKLEEKGANKAVTTWKEVEESELVAAFAKEPGTIWGFEYLREPYVEAAHSTAKGDHPVRMIELWDAVKLTLSAKQYEDFLADPDSTIDTVIDKAEQIAKDAFEAINDEPNKVFTGNKASFEKFKLVPYEDEAFQKKYIANLRTDARKFLQSFAQQVPKGSLARKSLDDPNNSISKISGVDEGKFMGAFACKAGLYNARDEGEPVYYCLDGIDMRDATDYKKVKYKAIEEYLDPTKEGDTFKEVITMKEVREILRNWDDLKFDDGKNVVIFVRKGKLMSPEQAEEFVAKWQAKMIAANETAGRRPAPDRANFAKELAAIDPGLPAKLDAKVDVGADEKTIDKDARDIVRKAGYLLRISKSNPRFVVKYLMSKCEILVDYDLIPGELVAAAIDFGKVAYSIPPEPKDNLKAPANKLKKAVKTCAKQFAVPLAEALVQHPALEHSKRLAAILKKD